MVAPERYRVRLHREASDNIIQISAYIERTSPQNAVSVADQILEAIDSLEILPHRYKIHRWNRSQDRIVRSMPVPPFVVFYRIRERVRAVEVLSVKHGTQQPPKRFRCK